MSLRKIVSEAGQREILVFNKQNDPLILGNKPRNEVAHPLYSEMLIVGKLRISYNKSDMARFPLASVFLLGQESPVANSSFGGKSTVPQLPAVAPEKDGYSPLAKKIPANRFLSQFRF
ncbi:MAG: hypothetical protein EZS28_012828 [Streblomastix strix]|uniref:Uncharacterized protein n=1 Tax=Streblomastix strix TaxID=222440 RepID=A0A5J4WAF8_9EUKA|nr:MAG: hypothetical protein EZS28_012828 [Streblomastix strix]